MLDSSSTTLDNDPESLGRGISEFGNRLLDARIDEPEQSRRNRLDMRQREQRFTASFWSLSELTLCLAQLVAQSIGAYTVQRLTSPHWADQIPKVPPGSLQLLVERAY